MDTKNSTTPTDKTPERWLPIPGFPAYDVSDQGRVRSYWRKVRKDEGRGFDYIVDSYPQRIMNPAMGSDGYLHITLHQEMKEHQLTIHRLVLLAFVGPCPPKRCCRHLNGVRTFNHLWNLAWGTYSENTLDQITHGTMPDRKGTKSSGSKLTDNQVLKIRELHAQGHSLSTIGKMFNVSWSTVWKIAHRQRWGHI